MKPKHQRMCLIGSGLLLLGLGISVILTVLNDAIVFFYTPTEIVEKQVDTNQVMRIGGLVVEGSIHYQPSTQALTFKVTDLEQSLTVHYSGIVPSLFRDGQGIVAKGILNAEGAFEAEELLAKHDENYMPPEVKKTLKYKEFQ